MALHASATRAQLFMRQCRARTLKSTPSSKRHVSSSHLAPSNFRRPLRLRDEFQNPASTSQEYQSLSGLNSTEPRFAQLSSLQQRPPITSTGPPIPGGFFNFLKYRVFSFPLPRPKAKQPPFNVLNNPYKARKKWPPDFRNLHPKQQFHFEKTFRRRMIIKANSKRYNWNRYVRLLQQSLIVMTLAYFVFIADPYHKEGGGTPVDGFRAWFFGQFAKNEHIPAGLRQQAEDLQAYYSKNANRDVHEIEEVTQRARQANIASSDAVLATREKLRAKGVPT